MAVGFWDWHDLFESWGWIWFVGSKLQIILLHINQTSWKSHFQEEHLINIDLVFSCRYMQNKSCLLRLNLRLFVPISYFGGHHPPNNLTIFHFFSLNHWVFEFWHYVYYFLFLLKFIANNLYPDYFWLLTLIRRIQVNESGQLTLSRLCCLDRCHVISSKTTTYSITWSVLIPIT